MSRKHLKNYSRIRYDDLPKKVDEIKRNIILGDLKPLDVNRQTAEDKKRLKLAKMGIERKYVRPGKMKRRQKKLHEFLLSKGVPESEIRFNKGTP